MLDAAALLSLYHLYILVHRRATHIAYLYKLWHVELLVFISRIVPVKHLRYIILCERRSPYARALGFGVLRKLHCILCRKTTHVRDHRKIAKLRTVEQGRMFIFYFSFSLISITTSKHFFASISHQIFIERGNCDNISVFFIQMILNLLTNLL